MTNTIKINREAWVVFLLACFLCLSNIGGYPITILDESKNAEAAREMLLGDYLTPTFNDFLRTDKPILHYLLMQLGYLIFGVNELGARIFGALAGAGFMTYLWVFLRKYATRNIARVTTLLLFSSFFWIQEFHLAVPDPYFIVLLCTSWLLFFEYDNNLKSSRFLWLFYVFVGLATLSKGPIAIGLTGLIILLYLISKGDLKWSLFSKYRVILGGLLVLLITLPWFIWVHIQTQGAYTEGFFLYHNIKRFQEVNSGHGGIFLITWGFVLLGLFPFGAFVLQGIWHGWKFRKRNDLVLFSLLITAVVIGFFSVSSTKLPNYTLPAIPFLAILIAYYFEEAISFKTIKQWKSYASLGLISLVSLAIPVAVFILFKHHLIQSKQWVLSGLTMAVVLVGLYLSWRYLVKEKVQNFIVSIASLWMVLGLLIFYLIYPNLAKIEPVAQAQPIVSQSEVVVFKAYDPAFNFNYKRVYRVIENEDELMQFIAKNPNTLVLTKDKAIENIAQIPTFFEVIFDEPSVFENYRSIILQKKVDAE